MIKIFSGSLLLIMALSSTFTQANAQAVIVNEEPGSVALNLATEEHPIVLNQEKLQRMLRSYESANLVDWHEIFTQNNFDDVKLFLAAYTTIDFNAIGNRNIVDVVNDRIDEIKTLSAEENQRLITEYLPHNRD